MVRKNWSKIGFGEVVSLSKSRHNPKTSNNSYPCIELEHIEQGTGRIIGNTPSSSLNSTKSKFKKGDVIFGKLRPYLRKYAMPSFNGVCSTEIWVFKPSDKILKPYLYHLIQTSHFISEANKSSGSKMPRADWAVISEMVISLPPLPEQQKIAKILTTWDKAIDTTERLIDNSKQQKKALMQQLLTGKKRLLDESGKRFEGEWEESSIYDISELMTDYVANGSFQSLKENVEVTSEPNYALYVRLVDLRAGLGNKNQKYTTKESYDFLKKSSLYGGELLMANIGANVGEVWQMPHTNKPATLAPNMLMTKFKNNIDSTFMYYYLSSEWGQNRISKTISGSGHPKINKTDLKQVIVPTPSLNEQQKIVAVLTNADKEIELLEQQLADLQQEKKALMQQLLTGKVRVGVD